MFLNIKNIKLQTNNVKDTDITDISYFFNSKE